METRKVNKFGSSYRPGVALDRIKISNAPLLQRKSLFRQAWALGRSEVELDGSAFQQVWFSH